MPETAIHTSVSREAITELVRSLPSTLAGKGGDPHGIAAGFRARLAFTFLSLVKEAFEVKGRGGTGSDGIQWEPLKPATIRQKVKKGMTAGQYQKWKADFNEAFKQTAAHFPVQEARRKAERMATEKHENRINRSVPSGPYQIMVDDGVLRNSLTVGQLTETGVSANYSKGHENQVFDESDPGEVIVGTNVEYARYQHYGTKHIPARPFWPEELPDAWNEEITRQASLGLEKILDVILSL